MCECCGFIFDDEGIVIGHQDCEDESPQSEQLITSYKGLYYYGNTHAEGFCLGG